MKKQKELFYKMSMQEESVTLLGTEIFSCEKIRLAVENLQMETYQRDKK